MGRPAQVCTMMAHCLLDTSLCLVQQQHMHVRARTHTDIPGLAVAPLWR